MQLYVAEVPGPIKDKLRPRVAQTAKLLWSIYAIFTFAEVIFLSIGGMDLFDAICHSFTTMSTGGYSTKNASIAYWDSAFIDTVVMVFMILAGINYTVLYYMIKGDYKRFSKNEELKVYLFFMLIASVITTIGLCITSNLDFCVSLREASFQVVSLVTGTGYSTADFTQWVPFLWSLMLVLMLLGGCAGSTAGGLKMVRVAILIKNSYLEFKRLLHPNAVIPVKFSEKVVADSIVTNVLAFVVLYILMAIISFLVFMFLGIGFEESIGAVVTSLNNVGPGIGDVGPAGNFSEFPDAAKWYMTFLMLTGRLEIFTVLFVLSPSFWKK